MTSCGSHRSGVISVYAQALGEGRGGAECESDAGDAGRPSDPIEDLPEDRCAD